MAQSQEYQGAWQLNEYQGAWQQQAQALEHSLSDSFTFTDTVSEVLSKSLSDSMSFADAVTWIMDGYLVLNDVMGFDDAVAIVMSKVLADSITFTDVISFVLGIFKSLTDSMAFSDTITFIKSSFLALTDSMTFADTTSVNLSKVLADSFTFTDSIATVATLFLNVSDSFSFADTASFAFSKVLSDIMVIADEIVTMHTHGSVSITERTIAELLADPKAYDKPWMPYIAIGSGDSPVPAVYDTALQAELYRKLGEVEVRANTYFVRATFGQDEPNADDLTIKEISIQDSASGGTMGKRSIPDTGISKDNVDEITIEFAVTILHGDAEALSHMFTEDEAGDGAGARDTMEFTDTIAFRLYRTHALSDSFGFSDATMPEGALAGGSQATPYNLIPEAETIDETAPVLYDQAQSNRWVTIQGDDSPAADPNAGWTVTSDLQFGVATITYDGDTGMLGLSKSGSAQTTLTITIDSTGTTPLTWNAMYIPRFFGPSVSLGSLGSGSWTPTRRDYQVLNPGGQQIITLVLSDGWRTSLRVGRIRGNIYLVSNAGHQLCLFDIINIYDPTCYKWDTWEKNYFSADEITINSPPNGGNGDVSIDCSTLIPFYYNRSTKILFEPDVVGDWDIDLGVGNQNMVVILGFDATALRDLNSFNWQPGGTIDYVDFNIHGTVARMYGGDVCWAQFIYRGGVWENLSNVRSACHGLYLSDSFDFSFPEDGQSNVLTPGNGGNGGPDADWVLYNVAYTFGSHVFCYARQSGSAEFGILSLDVSDLENPTYDNFVIFDRADTGKLQYESKIVGNYLYMASCEFGARDGGLAIFYIANPSNVTLLSKYDVTDAGVANSDVLHFDTDGNTAYLAGRAQGTDIHVVDLIDKSNPVLSRKIENDFPDWDIDNLHNNIGIVWTFNLRGTIDIKLHDGYLAFITNEGDVWYMPAGASVPDYVWWYHAGYPLLGVIKSGGTLHHDAAGIYALDRSSPKGMVKMALPLEKCLTDVYSTISYFAMARHGDYMFYTHPIAGDDPGLNLIRLSTMTARPQLMANKYPNDICIYGNTLFVVDPNNGLFIYDLEFMPNAVELFSGKHW